MSFSSNLDNIYGVVKVRQPYYVGLPGIDVPFTVHPLDQTPSGKKAILFYSQADSCTYLISSNYPDYTSMANKGYANVGAAELYRGIYSNGKEIVIPLYAYGNDYEDSVREMVEKAQDGIWLVRKPDTAIGDEKAVSFEPSAYNEIPKWSSRPFGELLRRCFKDHIIDSPNHPVATEQFRQIKHSSNMW